MHYNIPICKHLLRMQSRSADLMWINASHTLLLTDSVTFRYGGKMGSCVGSYRGDSVVDASPFCSKTSQQHWHVTTGYTATSTCYSRLYCSSNILQQVTLQHRHATAGYIVTSTYYNRLHCNINTIQEVTQQHQHVTGWHHHAATGYTATAIGYNRLQCNVKLQ